LEPVWFGDTEYLVPADSVVIAILALDALHRICGLRRRPARPGPDSWPDAIVLRAYALGRDGRWRPSRNSVSLPMQFGRDLEQLVALVAPRGSHGAAGAELAAARAVGGGGGVMSRAALPFRIGTKQWDRGANKSSEQLAFEIREEFRRMAMSQIGDTMQYQLVMASVSGYRPRCEAG
jgi:hypothetical protein